MSWKQKVGVGVLLGALATGCHTGQYNQQEKINEPQEEIVKLEEAINNLEQKLEEQRENEISSHKILEDYINVLTKKIEENETSDKSRNNQLIQLRNYGLLLTMILKNNHDSIEQIAGKNKELSGMINALMNNPLINRNINQLYVRMIIPTVKIESTSSTDEQETGSGTVLSCIKGEDKKFYSYILTAAHVIEDQDLAKPIKVYKYSWGQYESTKYNAKLISSNKEKDLALIEIVTNSKINTAKLIRKEDINTLRVFDKVYNVGCPLEIPPVPTYGEIMSKHYVDEDGNSWLINAPAMFGNSGGGVYLERTREFIGMFYALKADELEHEFTNGHKDQTLKEHDIVVPHLGLIVPADTIYSWLDSEGLQFIYDNNHTRDEWLNSRKK
ncbi:trypsin-like peptidase domain-containing protein [Candidatus Woesearchaeota archaeon]|nr:trypsin-like peptidase domain-containing protein [Candidatus Woesearchaeota archaeon]